MKLGSSGCQNVTAENLTGCLAFVESEDRDPNRVAFYVQQDAEHYDTPRISMTW
jgi:hypothetical protein